VRLHLSRPSFAGAQVNREALCRLELVNPPPGARTANSPEAR
jgi:hypothetical protein